MIRIKLAGGLGNQMFQYCFFEAFKNINNDKKVKLDYSWYFDSKRITMFSLDIFENIDVKKPSTRFLTIKKYLSKCKNLIFKMLRMFHIENDNGYDDNVFNINRGIIFGYFQNEKYFESIKQRINHFFELKIVDNEIMKLADEMQSSNSISVHIRRGDYLKFPERYAGICNLDYYEKAIKYMESKIKNPIFYVFSNDIKWAKENIKNKNTIFIDVSHKKTDWYDMYLMSCCKNNIIANSSFSWWSAYLNKNKEKNVVTPKIWDKLLPNKDSSCSNWIKL